MPRTRTPSYLEPHGTKWRVTIPVPKDVQHILGASRLKEYLNVSSRQEADKAKWAVIARLKDQIAQAKKGGVIREADTAEGLQWRDEFIHNPAKAEALRDQLMDRVEAIQGQPVAVEGETLVYDAKREAQAEHLFKVALGEVTPISALLDRWHREHAKRKEPTKLDDKRAVEELVAWCKANGVQPDLKAITRKVAGRYVSYMTDPENPIKRTRKTWNKYIACLSSYWNWLERKEEANENVWLRQKLDVEQRSKEESARPFTDDEIFKLIMGSPTRPWLRPMMLIAALTGARIEEVARIKVGDIHQDADKEGQSFRLMPQKGKVNHRLVPIHSQLKELVAELSKDKAPSDYLIEGLPEPSPKRGRSQPVSEYFMRYRRSLDVEQLTDHSRRSLVTFHSFRNWFITKCHEAGSDERTVKYIVDHKERDITWGTYSAGPSLEQKRAVIEAVRLPNVA